MPKVLCCVDGSDHSIKAAEFAAWLADGWRCPLVLVAMNQLRPTSGFSPLKQWLRSHCHRHGRPAIPGQAAARVGV
jgi:Universal stress protein family